jgi:hypothetical protein
MSSEADAVADAADDPVIDVLGRGPALVDPEAGAPGAEADAHATQVSVTPAAASTLRKTATLLTSIRRL